MKRFLVALAVLAGLGTVAARAETTLRFVPLGDLRVLDPIWTSAAITLDHAQMIYDVLVTMDSKLQPKLQMAESYTQSPDGMVWTFTLRPGLMFHDNTPLRAADVVASIARWGQRVTAGQALMSHVASMTALDARTLEIRFRSPFGPVLEALGSPVLAPFVMREQDAKTSAFTQVKTTIGSGPFTFVADAYRPGDKVLYRKWPGYVPRAEPADGYAGGKVAKVDAVEWTYLPDSATAVAALQTGEVDFLDAVPTDLVPLLKGNKAVTLDVISPSGSIGNIRPNSAHPPFNDPRARQALLLLVDQQDYLAALAPSPELGQVCDAVFVCGTPYATEVATGPWKHVDVPRAQALLKAAGYDGRKLVLLDPSDQPDIHTIAQITADRLRRAGIAVDLQTMDWSSVITRRNARESPEKNPSGWDIAFTLWGGFSLSSPLTNTPLVTSCDGKNLYGWPCDAPLEKLRAAYFDELSADARMTLIEQLQARYYEVVPYVNTGIFRRYVAYRSNISGVQKTMYPVMWNIEKK
jgi:peptide/nickel transport system substrate-binding protein